MQIHFLGTRGSVPSPGRDTVKYGGNTTCIKFVSDENIKIIIDAGTGLRKLNHEKDKVLSFIFTHCHWDHVQGLPFFFPIFSSKRTLNFYIDELYLDGIKSAIIKQMSGKSFPVQFSDLPSHINFYPVSQKHVFSDKLTLHLFRNNHPGGASGLKFVNGKKVFTFITDNEIRNLKKEGRYDDFLQFCSGSDILVHDGQYRDSEMNKKSGYGHSTVESILELFHTIKPGIGVITHHDPDRKDHEVDEILEFAQNEIKRKKTPTKIIAAYEDLIIDI